MWILFTTAQVADATDGWRYCSGCGQSLEISAIRQASLADTAGMFGRATELQHGEALGEADLALPKEDEDADYYGERGLFLVYQCPACGSGIIEGEADINLRCEPDKAGQPKRLRDRWRFLSMPISGETAERLKAQIAEEDKP